MVHNDDYMEDVKIRPYIKKLPYSYSFGVFPTIELLQARVKDVVKIIIHSKGKQNDGVRKIIDICKRGNIRVEIMDGFFHKLEIPENTYAVGVFKKYTGKLDLGSNHLVLVNPEDTGNLGTILRSSLGFGVKNVAIIRPGVDVFDPKTIRASMGAIFKMNVEYFESFEDYTDVHANKCYMFMTDGDRELNQQVFEKPFALVFGSESAGLDASFRKLGQTVQIRQSKDVDSLNLSIAVGIALYKSFS